MLYESDPAAFMQFLNKKKKPLGFFKFFDTL